MPLTRHKCPATQSQNIKIIVIIRAKLLTDSEEICSVNTTNKMAASKLYEVCIYSNNHKENTETYCGIKSELYEETEDLEKIVEEFTESLCPRE